MPANALLSPASRLRERERKRFHDDRKGRIPVMDAETLRELCLESDGFETPELNDNLYAHFQGFQRIEGLEPYVNLKALWLESNGLSRIENLASLASLRCLYLSKNLIERIEGLESLRELNTLDLSDNRITTLSGLAHLPQLSSLNLSRNLLATSEDLQELAHCAQLTNIDISHNCVEDPGVLAVLQKVPQLRALRITGNAVVSKTKYFRKVYISSLPQLAFLDRPIFPMERAAVTAWQAGGNEAELEAKRSFVNKENDERRRTLQEFRDWQAQVREKRLRELDEERALKEQQVRDAKENSPTNGSNSSAEDDKESTTLRADLDAIDLKGFRGITKEQYARLAPADRAKWDERIERAHADAVAERRQVLGDGVRELGTSFWAAEAEKRTPVISASRTAVTLAAAAPPPPSAPVLARDPAQFFRDVGEARETWAQLEQRARWAPFLHRPPALPSVHSLGDDDDDDSDADDSELARDRSNASLSRAAPATLRALTREQILREMRASAPPLARSTEPERAGSGRVTDVATLD